MRSPHTSALPHATAAVLTIATWLLTLPLKGTPLQYIWSAINDRGPFPYASIYFGYLNAIAIITIWARPAEERPALTSIALFCFAPLLIGIGGTLLGYHRVVTGVYEVLTGAAQLMTAQDIAEGMEAGAQTAWDPTILGAIITFGNLALLGVHTWSSEQRPTSGSRLPE